MLLLHCNLTIGHLPYPQNLNDLCKCVTAVVMVQRPHATGRAIRCKHSRDPQNCTVEFACSIPNRVLSSSKTNATTLRAIIFNLVAGKMGLLNQMQVNQTAHAVALFFNKCISTSVWMLFATTTMIRGKETN